MPLLLRNSIAPFALALLFACLHAPSAASAQATQVKPYFLVIFDTSGSMAQSPDVTNTCGYVSGGRAVGRKIDAAKCALGRLVNSAGDAEFGLMQFAQTWTPTAGGGITCSAGPSCGPTAGSALMRVPIESNTAVAISALIDNVGTNGTEELCSVAFTPLGGTLVAAKDYFEGDLNYEGNGSADPAPTVGDTALACRPLSVILLTDGVECCPDCDPTQALYNTGCPNANAEIEAAGLDPCPEGDPNACGFTCTSGIPMSCGPSCGDSDDHDAFETAPEKAWLLREQTTVPSGGGPVVKEVRTYVIGFSISSADDRERLERIAIGGGTDNPADGSGGQRAFYANDEAALSIAFSQIIADSQPPAELCNDLDDDCDTLVDEGFQKYCTPGGSRDLTRCEEPDELLCDGIDDDCDGIIDEGTVNECGACGDATPEEVCDGFDNDCDGTIDEGLDGGECGRDEGECKSGELKCVDGMLECEGLIGPEPEVCNGKDDDCDGNIDEGDLCPDGRCRAGECLPFCEATEFQPTCGVEREPETQENGECLCIIDTCPSDCPEQTQATGDGELLCSPDSENVAACTCRAGACTYLCDGISCIDGEVCDPRRGRCVLDNCRGLGCDEDELCDATTGECVADPCASASCDDDEVCRDGDCERSCAEIACPRGQSCARGRCVANPCANVQCNDGTICEPDTQSCEANPCRRVLCDPGLMCATDSGECERDPCFGVQCPSGQGCRLGECARLGGGGPGPALPPGSNVLATGGGGCACSALGAPGSSGTGGAAGLLGFAIAFGALFRMRTRSQRSRMLARSSRLALVVCALVALTFVLAGCEVSPYCLGCANGSDGGAAGVLGTAGLGGTSGGSGGTSGGSGGSGGSAGGDGDAGPDGGAPDACVELPEECNGMDDDCDLRVDEDVEALVNNCEQRGLCSGTEPVCVAGEFECQYPAEHEEDEETRCDGVDEDCDGDIDESFEGLGDPCSRGAGACATEGVLECNNVATGVVCDVAEGQPKDEVCDGIDNDCDGLLDEPKSEPGMHESYVHDKLVQVASSLWMYKYEASRPDSERDSLGVITERACSKEGVLPWTNLTYDEAVDACEAADMELCTEAEWINACNAEAGNCLWGFTPNGGACVTSANGYPDDGSACNGHDLAAEPGDPDLDALAPTGSFARCFANQMGSGQIFDLSGNAKEWVTDDSTNGALPAGSNPHRGGSYNNLPGGMRCDFAFAAANNGVRLRNVGFRCCTDQAP